MTRRSAILVLTLPGDDARRAPLLAELDRQGLHAQLFHGVDGRQGLTPEQEALVDREGCICNMRRVLTDPELACALSHRAIYQYILDQGLDAALVLEDDAIISPDLGAFLAAGGMFARPLILLDYGRIAVSRISGQRFGRFGRLWRAVDNAPLTTGYIVSAASARYLLEASTPVRATADWPGELFRARAYAIAPRLVDHPPPETASSHIESLRKPQMHRIARKSAQRYLTLGYWRRYPLLRLAKRLDP